MLSENEMRRIGSSLYRKTFRMLKRKGQGFYEAVNIAITTEVEKNTIASLKIKQQRGLIIYSLGSILIKRHPRLII